MLLEAGARLGDYEILSLLGAGGMGEVYRARNPHLGRDLAIKILAPHLALNREAVARFEREARAASGLNHPHILQIYATGEADTRSGATRYIAMELVEGETLGARFKRGARWSEIAAVLAQVADALAHAHRAGIVHRDLKPDNVMVTSDGYVKVVDFGLAKLVEASRASVGGESATGEIDGRTATGAVLGTIGYMSPEQVQGRAVDARSDVFSFGCMLYEALAGRRPFAGDSTVAVLHAIVYDDPPSIDALAVNAPDALRRIAGTCLAKDPTGRYQSMVDVAEDLRAVSSARRDVDPDVVSATATRRAIAWTPRTRSKAWWAGWAAAAVVVAVVTAVLLLGGPGATSSPSQPAPTLRVEKLTTIGHARGPAISPDGRYLAYQRFKFAVDGDRSIWLRDIAQKTETRLVGDPGPTYGMAWFRFARDGQSVYYVLNSTTGAQVLPSTGDRFLYQVSLIGGEPRLVYSGREIGLLSPDETRHAFVRRTATGRAVIVADFATRRETVLDEPSVPATVHAWSPDGTGLLITRAAADGHALVVLRTDGRGERRVAGVPQPLIGAFWSPDGATIVVPLVIDQSARSFRAQLAAIDVARGDVRTLGDHVWTRINPVYPPNWLPDSSGLVVNEGSTIWLVRFPSGDVVKVPGDTRSYDGLSMTADGRTIVSVNSSARWDLLVSTDTAAERFATIATNTEGPIRLCWTAGGRIVYSSNERGSHDLYVVGADGANRKQLTFDRTFDELEPAASPDGRYIVFVSNQSGEHGLFRMNADGSGIMALTAPAPGRADSDPHVTPDGQWVLYTHMNSGPTLWRVPIDGGTPVLIRGERVGEPAPRGALPTGDVAFGATASPDGRLLAFFSNTRDPRTGVFSQADIAIASPDGRILDTVPFPERKVLAMRDGDRVEWSADGRALYYAPTLDGVRNLWRRPVGGGPAVQVTHFEDSLDVFDWSFDGKSLACSRVSSTSDVVMITGFR